MWYLIVSIPDLCTLTYFKHFKPRLKEKVHINSSNQDLKFQTGNLAVQMHIDSLNLRLNFKPRFENLKPRFERKKMHINS